MLFVLLAMNCTQRIKLLEMKATGFMRPERQSREIDNSNKRKTLHLDEKTKQEHLTI